MKRLSAGVVPVVTGGEEPLYLLLRAFNYWDFPKGEVDKGEEPFGAAVRELREETGIEDVAWDWGKDFTETAPYADGKVARYYLARALSQEVTFSPNPVTGKYEHHGFKWLPYREAAKKLGPRVRAVLDWAQSRVTGG